MIIHFQKYQIFFCMEWKERGFWYLLLPHAIALFYTFIPCVFSGLILNHYSVKDIENGRMAKYAVRRGLLFGFFGSAFISLFFTLGLWGGIVFSLFLLSLAGYATIMGAVIGGAAGFFYSFGEFKASE